MAAVIVSSEEKKDKGIEKHVAKHTKVTSPTKKLCTKISFSKFEDTEEMVTVDTPSASETSRRPPVWVRTVQRFMRPMKVILKGLPNSTQVIEIEEA
ncbi:hypothetical protein CDAR_51761 [Caerostris darwini]|uniref:Uncharacterized protein n=1 Tax=Caerostris darwini TaxID=1538125 RepID=A0AAV4V6I6_9ARAC|nr:hypothetical protein CDAR_51761 [Caerostris darwini]